MRILASGPLDWVWGRPPGQLPVTVGARTWERETSTPTVSVGVDGFLGKAVTLARNRVLEPEAAGIADESTLDAGVSRTVLRPAAQVSAASFHPLAQASILNAKVLGVPVAV